MLIAQITDTHIVEKNNHWLSEPATRTRERLTNVVSCLNELTPRPDIVLLTGDASDTGTEESYRQLRELLGPLKMPFFIIPGNHDCREGMRKAFADQSYMPSKGFIHYVVNDYPVRLIGLDTQILGEARGQLCVNRLTWLSEIMHQDNQKPTLIFMHHPPAKTGNKVFDSISLVSPHFEHLIRNQGNFIGILAGHYHHLCVTSFGSKLCFIAPSVSPKHYFANPREDTFVSALELEDPAITLHEWESENVMTSHVLYVREHNRRIDWSSIQKKC